MNRIENEMNLLLEMAADLPGYEERTENGSASAPMREYFSGENDALERGLRAMWADDTRLEACIPLILAAAEKSRGQEDRAVVATELYNYSM